MEVLQYLIARDSNSIDLVRAKKKLALMQYCLMDRVGCATFEVRTLG